MIALWLLVGGCSTDEPARHGSKLSDGGTDASVRHDATTPLLDAAAERDATVTDAGDSGPDVVDASAFDATCACTGAPTCGMQCSLEDPVFGGLRHMCKSAADIAVMCPPEMIGPYTSVHTLTRRCDLVGYVTLGYRYWTRYLWYDASTLEQVGWEMTYRIGTTTLRYCGGRIPDEACTETASCPCDSTPCTVDRLLSIPLDAGSSAADTAPDSTF